MTATDTRPGGQEILLETVSKVWGAHKAVDDLSIRVPAGTFTVLLGPSGCGKSSILKSVGGFLPPVEGTLTINGRPIVRPGPDRMMVFQEFEQLLPWRTVLGNVLFPMRATGRFRGRAAMERARDILDRVGLGRFTDVYPHMLSGGMKRRLLVAKALVHNPPVLVLDEPTAGVDIELRRQLWEYVVKLNQQGVTIVLTTHYLEEAQELCDEIAIIDEGRVVASEPKHSLLRRLDRKTLIIEAESPLSAIPSGFDDVEAELRAGALAITYKAASASVGDLIARFNATGQTIRDLRTEEPDLEDVFLALTYNAGQNGSRRDAASSG